MNKIEQKLSVNHL